MILVTLSRPRVKLVSIAEQSNLMSNSTSRFNCGMARDHVVIFIMVNVLKFQTLALAYGQL